MVFLNLVGHAVGSAVVGAMVGDGVAFELFFALDPRTMMDTAITWQRRVSFIMVRFFVYYFESKLCYCVGYESDAFDVVDGLFHVVAEMVVRRAEASYPDGTL